MMDIRNPAVSDEDQAEKHCRDTCPGSECETTYRFVVYSPAQWDASGEGACFWGNDEGWTSLDGATHFTYSETRTGSLPVAHGQTAVWMLLENAKTMNVHKFKESRRLQAKTP